MKFGICTSVENSAAVEAAGWEFVEENVSQLLQGQLSDAEWHGAERAAKSALPIPAANVLVPGSIKITGPQANLDLLQIYMTSVLLRAQQLGIRTLVFGSGGARKVPDGFDPANARQQIMAFLRMIAPIAQKRGVTMVIEHLNRKECNILNTVEEAMTYVTEINHPAIKCLVDSYHFWLNDESLETLAAAMPAIRHVHVADKDGRVAPGQSGTADYKPLFRVLKQGGYDGPISVEAKFIDAPASYVTVLGYLKDQWASC